MTKTQESAIVFIIGFCLAWICGEALQSSYEQNIFGSVACGFGAVLAHILVSGKYKKMHR
jgi:hypothetical protein